MSGGKNLGNHDSRKNDIYPIKVSMPDRYQKTCASEDLKKNKIYYVERTKSVNPKMDWDFNAYVKKAPFGKKDIFSVLNGESGGFCWATKDLSPPAVQGCGLATAMMGFCFEDDKIGGIDPRKDYNFKLKGLEKWQDMAILNYNHIVYTSCNPAHPTPVAGCAAYMTAALNTGHTMMFTYPTNSPTSRGEMNVLNIATEAKPQLKEDADQFRDNNGAAWYFCRCKDDRVKECEAM